MAYPIGFAQANTILKPPAGTPPNEIMSLEVFRNGSCVVSRWQFSDAEIEEMKRNGGKCYLLMLGATVPPACVSVQSPFETQPPLMKK